MEFLFAFILGLSFINVYGQTWPSQYDTSLQGTSLNFDYTGDTTRSITRLIFDQNETHVYGVADGSTSTGANSTMIFKADLDLNFQWAMAYNYTIFGSKGFEIDTANVYLYFTIQVPDWIIGRMFTDNGTIENAQFITTTYAWDMVLSKDDQFAYLLLLDSKTIFAML